MPTQWPQLSEAFIHFHSEGGSKTCQNFTEHTTIRCLHFKIQSLILYGISSHRVIYLNNVFTFFKGLNLVSQGRIPFSCSESQIILDHVLKIVLLALTGARFHPPPIPENTFIHLKTQQLWPRTTRWEPLDSRVRFSILTASFQSPVRLEKVGSRGKRGLEDTPHTRMCLGTRRNQCPERPKKLKKKSSSQRWWGTPFSQYHYTY